MQYRIEADGHCNFRPDLIAAAFDRLRGWAATGIRRIVATSQERFQGVSDRARAGAAKAEVASIRQGLGMFQAESDDSAFPRTAQIRGFDDLRAVLSPYLRLPGTQEEMSFDFVSYTSAKPDTFVLVVRARDTVQTLITATPRSITP